MRDLDEEYDELMDELDAAVAEPDSDERATRIQSVRRRIEDVLREQMGLVPRRPAVGRRHGPRALH